MNKRDRHLLFCRAHDQWADRGGWGSPRPHRDRSSSKFSVFKAALKDKAVCTVERATERWSPEGSWLRPKRERTGGSERAAEEIGRQAKTIYESRSTQTLTYKIQSFFMHFCMFRFQFRGLHDRCSRQQNRQRNRHRIVLISNDRGANTFRWKRWKCVISELINALEWTEERGVFLIYCRLSDLITSLGVFGAYSSMHKEILEISSLSYNVSIELYFNLSI